MSTPPSALPASMQARMAALQAESGTPPAAPAAPAANDGATPPAANTAPVTPAPVAGGAQAGVVVNSGSTAQPTAATPPAANDGDRVTLSRDEYNEMRASASRVQAVLAREEMQADRLLELTQRLTELEKGDKPSSNAPASTPSAPSGAPVIDTSAIQFTDEENTEYGESRGYIEKIVDLRIADKLNKLVPELRGLVEDARNRADTVATTVTQDRAKSFLSSVKASIPDMDALIKHPLWGAFLDETEELSGATFNQLIAHNVQHEKLENVKRIYDRFRNTYVTPAAAQTQQNNAGYAGANPNSTAAQLPQEQGQPVKLKLSDRKKASLDYRHGRITFEQLNEVNKKFDEAEKAGNIDYNA